MVCELKVLVIEAGSAAFVAIEYLEQIPMKAGLIRPESAGQLGDVQARVALARQATDRRPVAAASLPPSVPSENGYLFDIGDPREWGRRTNEGFIPAPACLQALW
jgi:hypothetical protein